MALPRPIDAINRFPNETESLFSYAFEALTWLTLKQTTVISRSSFW